MAGGILHVRRREESIPLGTGVLLDLFSGEYDVAWLIQNFSFPLQVFLHCSGCCCNFIEMGCAGCHYLFPVGDNLHFSTINANLNTRVTAGLSNIQGNRQKNSALLHFCVECSDQSLLPIFHFLSHSPVTTTTHSEKVPFLGPVYLSGGTAHNNFSSRQHSISRLKKKPQVSLRTSKRESTSFVVVLHALRAVKSPPNLGQFCSDFSLGSPRI